MPVVVVQVDLVNCGDESVYQHSQTGEVIW